MIQTNHKLSILFLRAPRLCLICVSVAILISCNGSSSGSSTGSSSAGETTAEIIDVDKVFPTSIQKGGKYRSLEQIRVQAMTIISDRAKKEPEALSIITSGYWHPEAVINGRDVHGQGYYEGYWIKFEDDLTYRYGVFGDLLGTGQYHFRLDDEILMMLDSDVEQEPKVWSAKANGRAIALAGRHDYNVNNGIHMKLVHLDQQPSK